MFFPVNMNFLAKNIRPKEAKSTGSEHMRDAKHAGSRGDAGCAGRDKKL
jgi:hypothetical protein